MISFLLTVIRTVIGPVLDFLNKRVDSAERVHLADNTTIAALGASTLAAQSKADELNAQIRLAEGKWSPWVLGAILLFMLPIGFHTWQVILDSSPFHIWLGDYYLPELVRHPVGSWKVAALPGMWATTEHAVIQSLFMGAGTALAATATIKAIRGR